MEFFTKKTIGVEISHDGIAGATIVRGTGNPTLIQASRAALPQGVLQRSMKAPQVLQPEAFVQALREAWLALQPHTNQIALSLPDSAGYVSLVSLDEPWKTHDEAVEVLGWKTAKKLCIDPASVHLDFQLIERRHDGSTLLLAALTHQSVITQYEELAQAAGLQPVRINFHSLNLFNLFDTVLTEPGLAVLLYDSVLSILAVRYGKPFFLRTKQIPSDNASARLERELGSSLTAVQKLRLNEDIGICYYLLPHEELPIMDFLVASFDTPPRTIQLESVVQRGSELTISAKPFRQSAAALGAALGGH